MFVIAIIIMTS